MIHETEMGGRVEREPFEIFEPDLEVDPEPKPSPQPEPKCRELDVRDLVRLAARPATDQCAPAYAVEAMVHAAMRVMAKPGGARFADLALASAALVEASVPTAAQALINLIKSERAFSVAGLIAAVETINAATHNANKAHDGDTAAMQTTPDVRAEPD